MSSPTSSLRRIWQSVFNDSLQFIDLYFSRRYPIAQTFTSEQDGHIVAQAQCLPYTMTSAQGQPSLRVGYVSGLATLPQYRGNGHATKVMNQMHQWLKEQHFDYCLLIPADKKAEQWYTKHFDYRSGTGKHTFMVTASQIAQCTPLHQLSPHLIHIIRRDLASSPYTVQHTTSDLRDQLTVCQMSGGGLYTLDGNIYFMAEKISTSKSEEIFRVLDLFANSREYQDPRTSLLPPHSLQPTTYMYLPICATPALPDNLRITLMLD